MPSSFRAGRKDRPMIERHRRQFMYLYAVAMADLEVHPQEVEYLRSFGESRGIPTSEMESALMTPFTTLDSVPTDPTERVEILFALAQLIWADGIVQPEERRILLRFCDLFEFDPEDVAPLADLLLEHAEQAGDLESLWAKLD